MVYSLNILFGSKSSFWSKAEQTVKNHGPVQDSQIGLVSVCYPGSNIRLGRKYCVQKIFKKMPKFIEQKHKAIMKKNKKYIYSKKKLDCKQIKHKFFSLIKS